MNMDLIKKELKNFAANSNLQRRQPMNSVWEIYTAHYLPEPYESLVLFMRVYFEKDAIEIELLRKEKWESINFLTDNFTHEVDESYTDEDHLGYCKQYIFHFNNEEKVKDFLSKYQAYIQKLLKKQ